jgi:DNA-binding NarL/FixJ family response regulator
MHIFLADDQPGVRSALRLLLEQEPGLHVVGEAAETETLLTGVQETQPDLLLLDWELPARRSLAHLVDPPGTEADDARRRLLTLLHALCPNLFVIALSCGPEARQQALAAGADAFVSKGDPPEHLLATVTRFQNVGKPSA